MVDAGDSKQIDGLAHVFRRPLFPRVRERQKPRLPCLPEHALELARWVSGFRGVEPHAEDSVAVGHRHVQRAKRIGLVEMPQEAHDELGRDAEPLLPLGERGRDALQNHVEGHPPSRVRLWIEEHLHMHDAIAMRTFEIGEGQVVKVTLVQQRRHALVVHVQERLQVGELVRGAQFLRRSIRQPNAIAARDFEHQLGLERALDVNVQLGLRQSPQERIRHLLGLLHVPRLLFALA